MMQHSSGFRRSVLCCATRNSSAHGSHTTSPASPDWQGPPTSYSLQQACKPRTREVVAARFGANCPLNKLVEDGTLVLYQRPESYEERREDGYREPEDVFIVGTSHVSEDSAKDVDLVINTVKPDAVIVELCKGRSAVLYQGPSSRGQPPPLSMTGENLFQAFFRSLTLGGTTALAIQVMLSYALRRVIPQDGSITPGLEFKHAYRAANQVDAQIVLGDRPIEITIDRCFAALSNQRRWELAKLFVKGVWQSRNDRMDAAMFKQTIDKMKSEDGVDAAMQQLLDNVPELVQPLLNERDLYLAWSMKRSKAVNGTSQVVGVVGKGHLKGIMFAMENDPHGLIRFRDLVGSRNTKAFKQKQKRDAFLGVVRDTLLFGALGWLLHEYGWF